MQLMEKLHKLGIVRGGTYTWKGSGEDRPIEAIMDDVYDPEKDLMHKGYLKKMMGKDEKGGKEGLPHQEEPIKNDIEQSGSNMEPEKTKGKIFFWVAIVIAIFFIFVNLIFGGLTIWFFLTVAFWVFFLVALWRKIQVKAFTLGQSIIFVILLSFASIIFLGISSPDEAKDLEAKYGINRDKFVSGEKMAEEAELDYVGMFKKELVEETGVEFGEISDEKVLWQTKGGARLQLSIPKTFEVNNPSFQDVQAIDAYFMNNNWTDNDPVASLRAEAGQAGYSAPYQQEFQGIMCIVEKKAEKSVKVMCGCGPSCPGTQAE